MQYFLTVCECGNVTKAAEQLYVSRPVVSKVLRDLEEEFGASLFIRTSTGIIITEQGNALRKFIEGYSSSYALLHERVRELDTADGRHFLRVGVAPTSIRWFFKHIYFPLKKRHKDLRLFVSELPAQDSFDAVLNGDVDFSITPKAIDDSYSLNAIQLYESEIVFCASETGEYSKSESVVYDDIVKLPMVLPFTGTNSPSQNPVMFIAQADVMRMAVESGEVYSVLPREVTEGWDGVSAIPFTPNRKFVVNLIWNNLLPHKEAFNLLMEYIKDEYSVGM